MVNDPSAYLERSRPRYSITCCGESFEIENLVVHRRISGGEVTLQVIPTYTAKDKQALEIEDLEQVVISIYGQEESPVVARSAQDTPNVPFVGIAIQRVDEDEIRLHLTEGTPQDGDYHLWQEYNLIVVRGQVAEGYGSAQTFSDVSDRGGKETGFTSIEDRYDPASSKFVGVNFGEGAMGKLLRLIGLPTDYTTGGIVVDSRGTDLLSFDVLVKRLLELSSTRPDAAHLLSGGEDLLPPTNSRA